MNLVIVPTLPEAFEMLKAGSVDVVIADERVGAYILADHQIDDVIIVGEPIAKLNSSIAVKKGNTELLAEINKGISAIKEDGSYQHILDKWQPKDVVYLTKDQIRINQYETGFCVLILLLCVSIIWWVLLFRQLSKRKNMEKLLAEERQRLSDIIAGTNVGTWVWNIQTGKMVFNERWAEIIGYTLAEMPSFDINVWQELICVEDLEETKKQLDQVFAGEIDYYDAEYRMKHKDGNWVWVNTKGKVISRTADGKPLLSSGMSMDITDRKKAEDEILYLSYYDYLTGIYNRRFYGEELKRLDNNRNLPLTLIMGDVNGLKKINDTMGHSLGDALLKKVAELLKKACRSGDIAARFGGDEFVIILPSTTKKEAEKIIERINAYAKEENVGGTEVSIAFGCATKENEDQAIQDVFKKAEEYMYQNKICESTRI